MMTELQSRGTDPGSWGSDRHPTRFKPTLPNVIDYNCSGAGRSAASAPTLRSWQMWLFEGKTEWEENGEGANDGPKEMEEY